MIIRKLIHFLFEVGYLKNVSRSGWWLLGNSTPESVAEHSFRCAIIGYFLAKSEDLDTLKVIMMCLFHDIHEARINDLHKIAQKYVNIAEAEAKASKEQLMSLKNPERREIENTLKEFSNQESRESIVARDADILECAMQAREYQIQGYDAAIDWLKRAKGTLRSKLAKRLLSVIECSDPNEWWKKLKDGNK
ncbi:MAG: HD family hydrolase [Candidatus Scalinduaceae bacterium]